MLTSTSNHNVVKWNLHLKQLENDKIYKTTVFRHRTMGNIGV